MSNQVANNIVLASDIAGLLDGWIEQERNGVQFPVPFDLAWGIAGYGRKSTAKRDGLKGLKQGFEYCTQKCNVPSSNASGATSKENISLSVDAMKHMCLMACTEEGRQVRQYFIESEKKWKLVQQIAPAIAEEVEILHLKLEIAKIEAQKAALEDKTISLRHYVVATLPQATADRILGVTTIEKTEIRTKIVDEAGFVLNAGETVSKTALAERYGFVSRTGKADTKTVTQLIEEAIAVGAIDNPWRDVRVVASAGFDASLVPTLDRFVRSSPRERQLWVGE